MPDSKDILIIDGSVITGDGKTSYEKAFVRVRETRIVDVGVGEADPTDEAVVIDASGCTTIPGVINAHAHGCVHGPSMPSGSIPFSGSDIEYFRNRHLTSGTTTLLNVCGLALSDEIDNEPSRKHALDIHVATAHTPSNVAAALAVDGKGLSERHKAATVEAMIERGAKALGEAGGGQTLGGGAQDYRFLPSAIAAATGLTVHLNVARSLKEAVLGRCLDGKAAASDGTLEKLLREHGLDAVMDAARLRRLVTDTVMPPVELSLKGFEEIAMLSALLGYPAVFHNATPTAALLLRLAEAHPRARMVAGHSNHPSFTPEEAVRTARALRERGVTIDVSTLDCVQTRWRNSPESLDALIEEDLVDTLSTDFAGGDWDSILSAIHRIIRKKQMSAAKAVALATGTVASVFPEMAGDRGLIAKGKRADLVISESHNLSRVRHVVANGRIAVLNGALAGS
jgi:alpha-D-ribose 1-methylphosphonate 5-triphosphate diphosphatase PhnM